MIVLGLSSLASNGQHLSSDDCLVKDKDRLSELFNVPSSPITCTLGYAILTSELGIVGFTDVLNVRKIIINVNKRSIY